MAMEKPTSDSATAKTEGKVTTWQTMVTLLNLLIKGVGTLSVPFAFSLANYWAIPLVILAVGIMTFSAYLVGAALKIAGSLEESAPTSRDYIYLAELSFGRCGKTLVTLLTVAEVWMSAVACLAMGGSNMQFLLSLGKSQSVLVVTIVSSFMAFIPLRIYAHVSGASMLAMLMGCSCFVGDLFTLEWSFPDVQFRPDLGNLFRAYGLFMYCFAAHPCLPSFHDGMQHPKRFTVCVFWSYAVAMVFYLSVGLVAFVALGEQRHAVLTADISPRWLQNVIVVLFAVKMQLTIPLTLKVLIASLPLSPSYSNVKEFLQTSWPVALLLLVTGACACTLAKEEAALASITGALLMNATCVIIPVVMYAKLSLRLSPWSQQRFPNKAKLLLCGIVVTLGFITAAGGTYSAVLDMID